MGDAVIKYFSAVEERQEKKIIMGTTKEKEMERM